MRKLATLIALPFAALLLASACGGGRQLAGIPTPGAPAAAKIAFESCRPEHPEDPESDSICDIYAVNADGSGLTNVTNDPQSYYSFTWSPDGSRIAFQSFRDGNAEIYTINPDGSGLTNLTNDPSGDLFPVWSPGGSRIAFDSDRDHAGDLFEIYAMNSDGSAWIDVEAIRSPSGDQESPKGTVSGGLTGP